MLPRNALLAVAVIGVIAIMLLPSSVMASNVSNPYNVFEPARENENIGFERDGRAIYSDGTREVSYRASIIDSKVNFGIYLIVDIDWNNIGTIDSGDFDLWIGYNTLGPYYKTVKFTIESIGTSQPNVIKYYLSYNTNYAVEVSNTGIVQTTERYERIYISIESTETTTYNYLSIRYWTESSSYSESVGHVKIRRTLAQADNDRYLCVQNNLKDGSNQYTTTTVTQFDDPSYPPQWRGLQTVTSGYDAYDPWKMIQRTTTSFEQILPTWKNMQTISTDIVSHLLKWMPLQNVRNSYMVQSPVWTMIHKVAQHLNVTSMVSQGVNLIVLLSVIFLPSLIAYAIVGRPGLIIGLMTTTIMWTINEPAFLVSAFIVWSICGVVMWRSIR